MARKAKLPDDVQIETGTEEPTGSFVETLEKEAGRQPGDEPQREPRKNPFSMVVDDIAGVTYQLHTHEANGRKEYFAEIVFRDGKPSDEARQLLKGNGFKWRGDVTAWVLPIGYNTQAQDKVHARRVAGQVIDMIRAEKGEPAAAQGEAPAF